MQTGRPVLGIVHEKSTAATAMGGYAGSELVTFGNQQQLETRMPDALKRLVVRIEREEQGHPFDESLLGGFSARNSAHVLAQGMDLVLERSHRGQQWQ